MSHQFTEDSIFRGKIKVYQPHKGRGYRFTVDSVLLGHFASRKRAGLAVDLGAGSGVVGFILLFAAAARSVIFVERDETLVKACRYGLEANGYAEKGSVVKADIRHGGWQKKLKKVSLVVSNPPYRKHGSGRVSSCDEVAAAKHEATMGVDDVVKVAAGLLESKGRLCLTVGPERLDDVFNSSAAAGLKVVRLRVVHSKPDKEAGSVLVEMRRRPGKATAIQILPPLIILNEDGTYTREVEDILEGKL